MSIDYQYQLQRLLNKVNRVTSAHRHLRIIPNADLDALSDRQIEVEQAIKETPDNASDGCSKLVHSCERRCGNPFCRYCGEKLQQVVKEKAEKEEKKHPKQHWSGYLPD